MNIKIYIFGWKPYVKSGIFEKKIILVKQHFLMKKIINLKILHEKNSKTKNVNIENLKTNKFTFLVKNLKLNDIF